MSPHSDQARVTLTSIASQAGVSRATVSKALNGRQDVSEATRRQIVRLAEDLGYKPPGHAGPSEPVLSIVFETLDTYYSSRILAGAVAAAHEHEVVLDVRASSNEPQVDQGRWIRRLADAGHLAVVMVTMTLTEPQQEVLADCGLPVVMVDPAYPVPDQVPSISSANWNGGVSATEHLLSQGHRRIGFVAGPPQSVPARERLAGFRSAMLEAGLEVPPGHVRGDAFTYASGLAAGLELLDGPVRSRPTALVTACDVAAMGVYEAARRRGLAVPQDLSVVGFDDTFLAECAAPPLTTVHQALETMGARAVDAALDMAAGSARTVSSVQIPTHLVTRASTAAR